MSNYDCERCGLDFKTKQILIKHLKRKNICLPLLNDIDPIFQIQILSKKDGINCSDCNGIFKNEESLRNHRIRMHEKKEINLEEF